MNIRLGRRVFVFAAVLSATATALLAGNYSWTTTGPEAGQVFQIMSYASNPNRLYLIDSYFGGYFFRTDDRGQNWCYVERFVSAPVATDPTNPDVLYSLYYPYPVQKTSDGGVSWTNASNGLPSSYGNSLVVAPSSPSRLYITMSPGGNAPQDLYRSDDGAATWHFVASGVPKSYGVFAVDALDPDALYASEGDVYWKSSDGGATWNPAATGLPPYAQHFYSDPRTPGRIWAAAQNEGLYLSTDGGASYAPSNAGIETQSIRDLAFDRADSRTLYAAAQGTQDPAVYGDVFVSRDSGASWDRLNLGIQGPHGATAVAVDPAGSARVYAGAGLGLRGGFYRSPDGGASWTRSDKGLSGYYSNAVAAHPGIPNAAFGTSGAGLFGTLDAGGNWAPLPAPGAQNVLFLLFDPTNAATLYGRYNGGVYKSVDGGGSWDDASAGLTSSEGHGLAIGVSTSSVLLTSDAGGIWKSTNAAGSWDNVLTGNGRAVAVDPADPNILYASRSYSSGQDSFLRSDDGGTSWNPPAGLPQYGSPTDLAIPPDDPTNVYALLNNAVYKSTDRGLTFSPAVGGFPPDVMDLYRLTLDPATSATLYASNGLGGGVLRTTNGAASWRLLARPVPAINVLDFAASATGRDLYASTPAGIFQFHRGFLDVGDGDPYWGSVDASAMNGVTAGCGSGRFCPTATNTRAQIAPMLIRAIEGAGYVPPAATGTVFADVPAASFAADWIEELAHRGISGGCGSGNYCPSSPMTRAALAVLLLKAKHGSDYEPPPATGTVFLDVPADAFAAAWIEELHAEGITAGCGGGNFCPGETVLRSQAVTLIVKTFGLS